MTQTCTEFEMSLNDLLTQLRKKDWAIPLKNLEQKFRQIPDPENSFRVEILNMLHQLHVALQLDVHTPVAQLAAIRLSAFECWTYRFFRDEAQGRHYLNPLTIAVPEFDSAISVSQSGEPFPSTDIIKRWAREQLL